ncbi:hypothetical protein [Pseudoxanthomonas sp.]|uniref:hypothetical protein n=1 Tax=Pseudoxanthomonas sp. TaxID=1871049 RepID=UPI0035B320CB
MSEVVAGAGSPLRKLELALQQEAAGGRNKKDADFREAYPLIERYLASKVSQKVCLERFNAAYGHKLHPPRFRKMLEEERERRVQGGEDAMCPACGQKLHTIDEAVDADSSTDE